MSRDRVGLATWEDLSPEEQDKLIEMEIWKQEVYEKWIEDKQEEEMKKFIKQKGSKALRRRKQRMEEYEEDDNDYIE